MGLDVDRIENDQSGVHIYLLRYACMLRYDLRGKIARGFLAKTRERWSNKHNTIKAANPESAMAFQAITMNHAIESLEDLRKCQQSGRQI